MSAIWGKVATESGLFWPPLTGWMVERAGAHQADGCACASARFRKTIAKGSQVGGNGARDPFPPSLYGLGSRKVYEAPSLAQVAQLAVLKAKCFLCH